MQINHHSQKEHTKMSKIAKFGCKMRKIQPCKVCKFCILLYCVRKLLPFSAQMWQQFQNIQNFRNLQGYMFRISQPNFAILLILGRSFRKYTFSCQDKTTLAKIMQLLFTFDRGMRVEKTPLPTLRRATFTLQRIAFRSGVKKHISDTECTTFRS